MHYVPCWKIHGMGYRATAAMERAIALENRVGRQLGLDVGHRQRASKGTDLLPPATRALRCAELFAFMLSRWPSKLPTLTINGLTARTTMTPRSRSQTALRSQTTAVRARFVLPKRRHGARLIGWIWSPFPYLFGA